VRSAGRTLEADYRLAPACDAQQPVVTARGAGELHSIGQAAVGQARRNRKSGESDQRPERAKARIPGDIEPRRGRAGGRKRCERVAALEQIERELGERRALRKRAAIVVVRYREPLVDRGVQRRAYDVPV